MVPDSLRGAVSTGSVRSAVPPDSLPAHRDTVRLLPMSPNALTDIIHYSASDSVALNVSGRSAVLYRKGSIDYQGMELHADDIVVDFDRQSLRARGSVDSSGNYEGRPLFKQDGSEYNADTINFNYGTKKGIITGVVTQEGDGFLHGTRVKKVNDSVMYLSSGQYTTCNYAHPHFAINFSKSKLVTGSLIVTGPAYVSVEDVPTPLALPFAFFPLTKGRSSGIIMPSYGWMNGRGYYLKDGGYYFALNDFMDLSLLGELYTNLSWRGEVKSNYYRRYRYRGSLDISYGQTHEGLRGDSTTYRTYSDFKFAWRHDQDAMANPNSRFSANVNLQSRNYNRTTTNANDYFNSTTTSSVSYTARLGNSFNLAAAFNESYNVQTGLMNIKVPSFSLSSVTFYPLRRKVASGSLRWYENISLSYQLEGANNVSVQDSDLFRRTIFNQMQYGVQHRIPLQSTLKVLRFFNWTNSLSYNERWHWSTIEKHLDTAGTLLIDTIRGFRANRDFSFSSSLSTRIYGMFAFRGGPLRALRHVVNPAISFSYRPDFGSERLGYWRSYTDESGYVHRYSIFEQSLYGGPSDGRSGRIAFSVGNNLEAKIKPLRDTSADLRKVTLIESLTFSMSYDLARDSLNWSDLNISGHTTLFRNLVLNYSGSFIPYVVDSLGRKHDKLLWREEHRLFRKSNSTLSAQLSYTLNNSTFKRKEGESSKPADMRHVGAPMLLSPYDVDNELLHGTYADFSMPWSLSFNYTLSRVSRYVAATFGFESELVQSLSFNGNFSPTENWRISFTSGYDFVGKGISYTSIDIYRDLHCWEMRLNWVPFGFYKSWNFRIGIKASSLKDVKYEKRQTYQENQNYSLY